MEAGPFGHYVTPPAEERKWYFARNQKTIPTILLIFQGTLLLLIKGLPGNQSFPGR